MLKKILFIVSSFLIGFLLLLTVINATVVNIVQNRLKEALASNNYQEVKRYYVGIYDNSKENFYVIDENGTHVEMFYGLANAIHTFKNESGEKLSYKTIETGIHFAAFHLTEDFKLVDDEGKQGGVMLHFYNTEDTLFFPFVVKENDEIVKNNYDSVSIQSYLSFAIEYQQYVAKVGDETDEITMESVIKSVDILDGTEEVKFSFTEVNGLTFDNQLYKEFSQLLDEYNGIKRDLANGKEVSKEAQAAAVDKVNKKIEGARSNPNYVSQPGEAEVYGSSEFLVPVIIAAVIFLALDILVAWLIFRKKKVTKYIPPHQQNTTTKTPYEPEQFNRDVFNVENYDEVESSEEASDETLQIEEKPTTEE